MSGGPPEVVVHLSSHVRFYAGGKPRVTAVGATVAEVMDDLERQFPGIRFRVVDEQERIRRHMNVFVNEEKAGALGRELRPGDEVYLLGSLSGG